MRFPWIFLLCPPLVFAAGGTLIVADEFPAMEIVAARLKAAENITSTLVKQTDMPADLSRYPVMIVYIHGKIGEPAEKAFIQYAESGGKLVLLHHSISSGKRPNQYWFPFLKITLPDGDFENGGYKWIDPVTLELVNLAPREYITTHKVKYDDQIPYTSSASGKEGRYPGFKLDETEVYLNHVYSGPRTTLLGLKYSDAKTGRTYMQDTAGWYRKARNGWVVYLMSGHSGRDFENPAYGQIVVNAVAAELH